MKTYMKWAFQWTLALRQLPEAALPDREDRKSAREEVGDTLSSFCLPQRAPRQGKISQESPAARGKPSFCERHRQFSTFCFFLSLPERPGCTEGSRAGSSAR